MFIFVHNLVQHLFPMLGVELSEQSEGKVNCWVFLGGLIMYFLMFSYPPLNGRLWQILCLDLLAMLIMYQHKQLSEEFSTPTIDDKPSDDEAPTTSTEKASPPPTSTSALISQPIISSEEAPSPAEPDNTTVELSNAEAPGNIVDSPQVKQTVYVLSGHNNSKLATLNCSATVDESTDTAEPSSTVAPITPIETPDAKGQEDKVSCRGDVSSELVSASDVMSMLGVDHAADDDAAADDVQELSALMEAINEEADQDVTQLTCGSKPNAQRGVLRNEGKKADNSSGEDSATTSAGTEAGTSG